MRHENIGRMNQVTARLLLVGLVIASQAGAVVAPGPSSLRDKEFRLEEFDIETAYLSPVELPTASLVQAGAELAALQAPLDGGRLDLRSGRWVSITPVAPLIPGSGAGNLLSWETAGLQAPTSKASLRAAIDSAFRGYLVRNAELLRVDLAEAPGPGRISLHQGGRIAQIFQQRVVGGVPVRGSYLTAVVNSGNLVLIGTEKWGDIDVATRPSVSGEVAWKAVRSYVQPHAPSGPATKSELVLVPLAKSGKVERGKGYSYRLAHVIRPSFDGDLGSWEALVDAHSGELISFQDTNRYAEVKGGVLPVTNDGIVPDGVEQPGWPMPFASISTTSGTQTTSTGGNLAATGSMTSDLSGPFIRMNDNCGSISLTQNDGLDFGASAGTDCATPGFGGAGNTHASRTGFYELNKIVEMAQSHLPSNVWLQQQLTSNMNINQTCNAFWGGGTVNFYRSGGGCFNTGEIAGVFDHEWGHGMDDNDANPSIASPSGEGIADIYAALRLNTSCIGRNFRSTVCTGFGDPCLTCTGVRDIDYLKRQSGQPHTYTWSNANCGGSVHCVGSVYSEAVWSLWKRKLQSAPYNMDNNTAHELVNRLTFIGAGNVGTWFSGGPPFGGCGSSGGYLNYLAADDDNGNLNDGTPHMAAIFSAFNDQEIACSTPTVQDSGCVNTPTVAPAVSASSGNQLVGLNWSAVPAAAKYQVFRTEGVFACDFGKVKLGETTGTSFNDSGLQNGRDYSYVVVPIGAGDSCMGPASACATAQPVGQPDFAITCSPSSFAIAQGDNDTSTCDVISSFGYTGSVGLSCTGNPAGVSCTFAPSSVSPPADGSAASTLTVTVDPLQATGTFAFDVVGNDGAISRVSGVSVQVIPAGSNGPQTAVYDSGLGAPKCSVAGSSCDSTTLLDSRDNLSPAEPNQPNTLDVCSDGTSGSYHNDESNDRIVVSTLDGGNFTEGDTVEIAATVYAWSTGSSDHLDLYYAADANNPVWTLITTINNPGSGVQTLTAQYVLPAGGMQAVRANFRYNGSASPCSPGTYDDHDDLVFTVEAPGGGCTINAECDDGLFCNGAETCDVGSGTCQSGAPPACDNGLFCDGVESCNEATDSCDAGTPPTCDDGLFCNGAESCNETTDSCDAGTPPACDDGEFCNGAETCNEGTDACDPGAAPCDPGTETCNEGTDVCEPIGCTVDADCDDGLFCNGVETCDVGSGTCNAGTAPTCDNGLFCDGVESCNEGTDSCDPGTPPACDDGLFCNGEETCNEGTDSCDAGTAPSCDNGQFCDGVETCNEGTDSCDAGTPPACDNGQFCDGVETCNEGTDSCDAGTPPSADDGVSCTDDSCDEVSDVIVNTVNNANCDNGQFCDGAEVCDAALDCQAGTPPVVDDGVGCTDDSCDEVNDVVVNATNNANCDNGLFCDGAETCDAALDCQAGTAPCGAGQSCNETADICEGGAPAALWMSFRSTTSVPGVGNVRDEDVVSYNEITGWALEFDGSDVGLGSYEIDGLAILPGGDLLLSLTVAGSVGGVSFDDSDVLRFAPTSLGSSTSGTFSLYFDGSDVGLTSSREDVDGLTLASDGSLIVSTQGGFSGNGASGADEDLFLFTATSLGTTTSGSFELFFDGSDVGLSSSGSEDVDAADLTSTDTLLFSTVGSFSVSGLGGNDEDVAEFAGSFGNSTSGSFSMRLDLSTLGISTSEDVGSVHSVD